MFKPNICKLRALVVYEPLLKGGLFNYKISVAPICEGELSLTNSDLNNVYSVNDCILFWSIPYGKVLYKYPGK